MNEEDEEFEINKLGAFIVGILIGGVIIFGVMGYYQRHMEFRSPEEIATYLEEMLFEKEHMEDLQHAQLRVIMKMDSTSIGDIKRFWEIYNGNGVMHRLLADQLNNICFKKEFKRK